MNHSTTMSTTATATGSKGVRARWNAAACSLSRWIAHDVLALASRAAIAAIFYLSGRTKVEGLFTITGSTYELFRSEYKLPLIAPEVAACLAAFAEHLFPVLLALGLLTRLSALVLLGMTVTIQVFVYPDAWPTHLSWAALLLYLIGRGAGALSFDKLLKLA